MKISVIGYSNNPEKGYLPEAISAGFARVSRSPKPISALVEEAKGDLEKARKSNNSIIYGYGHSSIAEHITFNLVFEEVSRIASAEIMHNRLNSYIEKSQRYIEIGSGYVFPENVKKSKFGKEYQALVDELFLVYDSLVKKLTAFVAKKFPEWKETDIKNRAKEDARFVLPLATYTQFGMTINARNYEKMIMRLKSHHLPELHQISGILLEEGRKIAPSVVIFTDAVPYFSETPLDLEKYSRKLKLPKAESKKMAELIEYDNDDKVLAALLFSGSNISMNESKKIVAGMSHTEKEELMKISLAKLTPFHQTIREFEYANFIFDVEMSEACYHQFLRHRMNTQTYQPYTADLGFVVPPLLKEAGLADELSKAAEKSTKLFNILRKDFPNEAPYILINAHKRRVLVQMNARELYHFTRLRDEAYAQWEIREIAHEMLRLAKEKAPLAMAEAGGRTDFIERHKTS